MNPRDILNADERMADLHHGPRIKSQATKDLEIVLRAYLTNQPVKAEVNRLGEIEISINHAIYNLTKILEHKPDFEHLDVIPDDNHIANALFRRLTAYRLNLDATVPIHERENMVIYEVNMFVKRAVKKGELLIKPQTDGLLCRRYGVSVDTVIPWDDLPLGFPREAGSVAEMKTYLDDIAEVLSSVDTSEISEAEARAIRFYTMDVNSDQAYEKINRFLRENGKIPDLFAPDSVDFRTMMFMLAYVPSGIVKLRESNQTEKQELYRGEQYDTSRLADMILEKRTNANLVPEAGFVSASKSEEVGKIFVNDITLTKNIHILLNQFKNTFGVDVAKYSENPGEEELLVMPGMQTMYGQSPADRNTLIAMPVRSIDEIYHNNYNSKIMATRTDLINYISQYEKQPNANPVLINLMDTLCQKLYAYGSGELVESLQACRSCIQSLASIPSKNLQEISVHNMLYHYVGDLINKLGDALMQEWSESNIELLIAANYIFNEHLQHAYKDAEVCDDDLHVTIDGVTIERPNHGLAHSMRKALYLPAIANAFKTHAKDQEFRDYLSSLTPERLELIQVAVMFSITGRESEATATNAATLKIYEGYRKQAKINFMNYVKARGLYDENADNDEIKQKKNDFIETLAEQIKYMGNPKFFIAVTREYRQPEKIFLYYMLNVAHDFDLMRCYELDKYVKAINGKIDGLAIQYLDDTFKDRAMPVLFKMVSDAINATGDRQFIKYENGKLVEVSESYQSSFVACSKDEGACLEACVTSNTVFTDVLEGKFNNDLPQVPIKLTVLQETVLSNDPNQVADALSDPAFQGNKHNELMKCLIDVTTNGTQQSWKKLLAVLHTTDHFNEGDLAVALQLAALKGDVNVINALLTLDANTTLRNESGDTALHLAIYGNMTDSIKELIKHADVNMQNDAGYTPLGIAVVKNSWEVVDLLLDAHAINLSGPISSNIIIQTMFHGKAEIALKLLATKQVIDIEDTSVQTPLWHAIKLSEREVVVKLLERGANIYADSALEDNCVNLALKYKDLKVIKLLAAHPEVNVDHEYILDSKKKLTGTLLHLAVEMNDRELFSILMQRNARFDIPSAGHNYQTAFQLAISTNHKLAISMLELAMSGDSPLDDKTKADYFAAVVKDGDADLVENAIAVMEMTRDTLNYVNGNGDTALSVAASRGNLKIVRILIDAGAELKVDNTNSPLMAAAGNNHWDVVNKLLQLPAVVIEAKHETISTFTTGTTFLGKLAMQGEFTLFERVLNDKRYIISQESLLYMAIAFCKTKISKRFEALFASGRITDVNLRDHNGMTMIQHAGSNHMLNIVEKLLTVPDIDVNGKNENGKTLLHVACSASRIEMVKLLLDKGAEINETDNQGKTAMGIAVDPGNVELVKLLLEHQVNVNIADLQHVRSQYVMDVLVDSDKAKPASAERDARLNQLLIAALSEEYEDIAQKILSDKEVTLGGVNKNNFTALHVATHHEDEEMIDAILARKNISAEINTPANNNETPASRAASKHKWDIVKKILMHPDATLDYEHTSTLRLLASACQDKRQDIIKELFEKFPPPASLLLTTVSAEIHHKKLDVLPLVSYLLENNGDMEYRDEKGNTSLMLAANSNRADLVVLLEQAAVRSADKLDTHPVMQAAARDDWESVKHALAASDLSQSLLERVLCYAVKDVHEHKKLIYDLLAKLDTLNSRASFDGKVKHTPLVIIAEGNDRELMHALLERMPALNMEHPMVHAAIEAAAKNDSWNVVCDVIEHLMPDGEPMIRPSGYDDVYRDALIAGNTKAVMTLAEKVIAGDLTHAISNKVKGRNFSPLHYAAQHGHVELTSELLEVCEINGLDTQPQIGKEHVIPFTIAVSNDQWELARFIAKHPACKINCNTENCIVTLMRLVEKGQEDIIRLVLRNSSQQLYDRMFITAIKYCADKDALHTLIKLVLEIDPALATLPLQSNMFPLHLAVASKSVRAVKMLMDEGANAAVYDAKDMLPIYYAMKSLQFDMVKLLLPECWDAMGTVKSKDILTFMDKAAEKGERALLDDFFRMVYPLDTILKGNKNLLQAAVDKKYQHLAEVLREKGLSLDKNLSSEKSLSPEKNESAHAPHATMFGSPMQKRPVFNSDDKIDPKFQKH